MKKGRFLLFTSLTAMILFLLLANCVWTDVSVKAEPALQGEEAQCSGLDVVFLIDQSSSMQYRDPKGIRSNAIRAALDMLGDNAAYLCPGVQHRVAVLGFGGDRPQGISNTVQYIPPTSISVTQKTLSSWLDQKEGLKAQVPTTDDLGSTDFMAAFEETIPILHRWRDNPISGEQRKQLVVIISDGQPCGGDMNCGSPAEMASYMERLEEFSNPNGRNLPWRGQDHPDSVYLSLIGFNPRPDQWQPLDSTYVGPYWERITLGHGGEIKRLESADKDTMNADLASRVTDVLNPFLGSRLTLVDCDEPIWIEPYRANVAIIHIFRHGANPNVDMYAVSVSIKNICGDQMIAEFADGKVISGTGKVHEYTRDGLNERYVFYNPPPGEYVIGAQGADVCKHLDVRFGESSVIAEVQWPAAGSRFKEVDTPPFHDPESAPFRIRLLQQTAEQAVEPLQILGGYVPVLEVVLQGTTGIPEVGDISSVHVLKLVDEEQAVWESMDPIETRYPGRYEWQLKVTTDNPRTRCDEADPDDTPIQVLADPPDGTYTVEPIPRELDVTIVRPGDEQTLSLVDGVLAEPLQVVVETKVLDDMGEVVPVHVPIPVSDDAPIIRLQLLHDDLGVVDREELEPRADDRYEARLESGRADPARYEPGSYQIVAEWTSNYNSEVFHLVKERDVQTVEMVYAERFGWSIQDPAAGTYAIHPRLRLGRLFPKPLSIPLAVQATSMSGEPLDATIVQRSSQPLFVGQVYVPDRAAPYELTFRPDEDSGLFVAQWPPEASRKGEYRLKVTAVSEASSASWILAHEQPLEVHFTRQDTLLTMPWLHLFIVAFASISGLCLFLIFLARGPLAGAVLTIEEER